MNAYVYVYGKPECVQCDQTKKHLDKREIPYVSYDVTADETAKATVLNYADELGLTAPSLPLVILIGPTGPTDMWFGFKIDKIRGIVNAT